MDKVIVKLAQTVELEVAKDAIDVYDLDAAGGRVYRCSLTVNKEEASALIAALELVHA